MPLQRREVLQYLVFLIIVMIVMNLFTVFTFWKADFDQRVRKESIERFNRFDTNPPPLQPALQRRLDEIEVEQGATSVRFITLYGYVKFVNPERGGPLTPKEWSDYASAVLRQVNLDNMNPRHIVEGTILVKRLKRALGGSGKFRDLQPPDVWKKLAEWPSNERLLSDGDFGQVLRFASQAKIQQAKLSKRGTQLKLTFLLEGGQVALFKPEWYPRDVLIRGDPYGGKDRHFGELAAFYLSQVLGFTNGPMAVGRKVNLAQEVLPVSTLQLNSTFFQKEGDLCFYGSCYYCNKNDPACAKGEIMEGALVLFMNQKLKSFPSPWRRTYKKGKFADWETNMSYCRSLLLSGMSQAEQDEFVLDIIAVSVFDFLIGNADRHHFDLYAEKPKSDQAYGHSKSIILVDNGKSFGNYQEDYFDILAPLYQCCRIRKELRASLMKYRGILGKSFEAVSAFDPLFPLLTPAHLGALDRRLNMILATIQVCQERNPNTQVVL